MMLMIWILSQKKFPKLFAAGGRNFIGEFFWIFPWTGDVEGAIYCSTEMALEAIRSILLCFPVFVVVA
jgi:hypothetical protein